MVPKEKDGKLKRRNGTKPDHEPIKVHVKQPKTGPLGQRGSEGTRGNKKRQKIMRDNI